MSPIRDPENGPIRVTEDDILEFQKTDKIYDDFVKKQLGMREFLLFRKEDISGVSGTGYVAEGVLFSSGQVAITWYGAVQSITIYQSLADAYAIHGHGGHTEFRFANGEVL